MKIPHTMRHTFSTTALEHGMDIKTLSTIIGHVSSSTTLNIYAHVTDEMRRTAAVKIDQGIGKTELQAERVSQHLGILLPVHSRPIKASGVRRGPDAAPRSTRSSGKAATLLSGPMAKSAPGTSTLTVRKSAKNCWQR